MKLTPNPYNLIVEIKAQEVDELTQVLSTIQEDLYENSIFPFSKIKSIHFGRFVILPRSKGRVYYPDYLVLSTNYDGSLDEHLSEMIQQANLDAIFKHCKGYNNDSDTSRLAWMKQHAKSRAYFYRGTWGRSTEQIIYEEASRKIAEDHIDDLAEQKLSAMALRKEIIQKAKETNSFKSFPPFKVPGIDLWEGIKIVSLLVLILGLLPIVLLYIGLLLIHEFLDDKKQYDKKYSDQEKTKWFADAEDKIVQNQLTHLVEIKPGWFRLLTLKLVLNGIAYLAKIIFNKGKLGGIPSIHFARWIIIDKGKRLLFFSNFDGSWENYLGDFVDKAAVGLTGVWSNTEEFPKTRFLLFKGARDEQRFKAWARDKQVFTNVWYSAYPELTVSNIYNNTNLQTGLTQELNEAETKKWLQLY